MEACDKLGDYSCEEEKNVCDGFEECHSQSCHSSNCRLCNQLICDKCGCSRTTIKMHNDYIGVVNSRNKAIPPYYEQCRTFEGTSVFETAPRRLFLVNHCYSIKFGRCECDNLVYSTSGELIPDYTTYRSNHLKYLQIKLHTSCPTYEFTNPQLGNPSFICSVCGNPAKNPSTRRSNAGDFACDAVSYMSPFDAFVKKTIVGVAMYQKFAQRKVQEIRSESRKRLESRIGCVFGIPDGRYAIHISHFLAPVVEKKTPVLAFSRLGGMHHI